MIKTEKDRVGRVVSTAWNEGKRSDGMVENREGLVRRMCAYNKAVSEPVRMKMIKVLGSAPNEEMSVGLVAETLHISQPVASKHLKILYDVRLVDRERRGSKVMYKLNEQQLDDYWTALRDAFKHKNTGCINDYDCDSCPKKETCV